MAETMSVEAVLSAVDQNFTATMEQAVQSLSEVVQSNQRMTSQVQSSNSQTESSSHRLTDGFVSMASAMGAVAVASKAFDVLKNAIGGAVDRFDTLNKYPVVMKALGYDAQDTAKSSQILQKSVASLPTPLNQITSVAQQLAPLTGSATKAAQSATALNDAFLASGSSAEDSSRGLLQYTQMLSTGKVDMMSYRTLMETMPIALRKVANSFGFTGKSAEQDLYKALQSGKITMDQLNDKFIELDGGMNGFADLAHKNSNGIATAFTVAKQAIVNGLSNTVSTLNQALVANGLPSIQQAIEKAGVAIAGVFKKITAAIPPVVAAIAPLIKHLGPLAPLLKAVAVAFVGLGVVAMLAPVLAPVVTVFGALFGVFKRLFGVIGGAGKGIFGLGKKLLGIGKHGKHAGTGLSETADGADKAGKSAGQSAGQILAMGTAILEASIGAAILVGSFALLVQQVTNLAKTGPMGAVAFLAVAAGMSAVIAVMGIVGKMLGQMGPQAAIAYAGMALLVVSFALLTAAVAAFASTGSQGLIALAAITAAIVVITAVMGVFAPIMEACVPGLLAFGAAVLMVGAGVAVAAVGIALLVVAFTGLVTALTGLAQTGPAGIAVIAALTIAIVAITAALAIFGPLLTASSAGLLAFGAAVLMVGVGVGIAAAGIALLIDALTQAGDSNSALGDIVSAVWSAITSFISGAVSAISGVVSAGFNAIRGVISAVMNAVKGVISAVWGAIKGVFNAGVSFIKSVTHFDISANGRAIMNSFFNGLKSIWGSIKSFVGNIAGWIKSHKGPISYDRRLLIPAGQAIMQGLNEGLVNGFSNVKSMINGVNDTFANMTFDLPKVNASKVSASLDAIHTQMNDMNMDVNGTLSSTQTINNVNSRLFEAHMTSMFRETINKLDNVDQHPVVTVDTANRLNDYNNKINNNAYVMWNER
jgi:tape measure domain-containing protein